MLKLLFMGDVCFRDMSLSETTSNEILKDVFPILNNVDFRIANLETPLADIDKYAPIVKAGPNIISSPKNISFLKSAKIDGVSLANNHAGDYGDGALLDTFDILEENQISYCGAGKNLNDSYRAMRFSKNGVSFSIIGVCEHEFGLADTDKIGTAKTDLRLLLKTIRLEKEKSDYVIVFAHGGNEYNPLPSPRLRERYRLFCDFGADAVVGTHSHCPQGYEVYDNKPIVYSMGNFLFKKIPTNPHDAWCYGYMCQLEIKKDDGINIKAIPYNFDADVTKINIFTGKEKQQMDEYIKKLSDIIPCDEDLKYYFKGWAYLHPWLPCLPEHQSLSDLESKISGHFDLLSCETHNEQATTWLNIVNSGEVDIAKEASIEIEKLMKLPV